MSKKQFLHLGANLHGVGSHEGAWRWPAANPNSFFDIEHYVAGAKLAEKGLFDTVFVGDSPAIQPDIAVQPPTTGLEPTLIAAVVTQETKHIGFISTASTTYNDPYNLARRLLSVDVVSGGRAAWNAVTTYNPAVAANFQGLTLDKAARYIRAEEFVEVVRALWQSWGEGTVIADQASGIYADTDKLKLVGRIGEHFDIRGPLTHPGSPQGYPVIIQAGGSAAGQRLAARSADVVFAAAEVLEDTKTESDRVRNLARELGRSVVPLIFPGLVTVIGGTEEEAIRRHRELNELIDIDTALRSLASRLQVDPESLDPDKPVPLDVLPDVLDEKILAHGFFRTIEAHVRNGRTVREIIGASQGRGNGHRVIVGTPEQIAASIEEWFRFGAVDGFNIMPDVQVDGLPAFVENVVPLLQRRGLFRTAYEGTTLRENLGIPLPTARNASVAA